MEIHYVKCSICGEKKFTNEKAYAKRVEKYGSVEKMEQEWKCRSCIKAEKEQV